MFAIRNVLLLLLSRFIIIIAYKIKLFHIFYEHVTVSGRSFFSCCRRSTWRSTKFFSYEIVAGKSSVSHSETIWYAIQCIVANFNGKVSVYPCGKKAPFNFNEKLRLIKSDFRLEFCSFIELKVIFRMISCANPVPKVIWPHDLQKNDRFSVYFDPNQNVWQTSHYRLSHVCLFCTKVPAPAHAWIPDELQFIFVAFFYNFVLKFIASKAKFLNNGAAAMDEYISGRQPMPI